MKVAKENLKERLYFIDVGLIGCGYAGVKHLDYIRNSSVDGRIKAICDVNTDAIETAKRQADDSGILAEDVATFRDATNLDYDELDGVIIATPHKYHCEQILTALANDTNVLVEKPLAITVEEARRVRSALEATDARLLVNYQKRYKPRYWTAKRIIENGTLGAIESVTAKRVKYTESPYGIDWRAEKNVSGGGQLFDIGNHMIDMLLWLTDSASTSCKGVLSSREGANLEVYANVIGTLEERVPYNLSLHAYGDPSIEEFYVSGSDGSLEITKAGVTLYDGNPDGKRIEVEGGEFRGPTEHFLAMIDGTANDFPNADRWIESIRITQQVYEECEIN